MLYLLDANVLIRAHEDYYGIEQVPQFWEWLVEMAEAGHVKMPFEIHAEIAVSTGKLKDWICDTHVKDVLILDEEVDQAALVHVMDNGYATGLTDSDLEKMGRDPFLVAYSLMGASRAVVTKEVSKPSRVRGNRKIPDVCNDLGVPWMTDFDLFKQLKFKAK